MTNTNDATGQSPPDPVAVLCERLWHAMDALGRYGEFDARRDQDRWDQLHHLRYCLRGDDDKPATDEAALIIARALLGEDVTP